MSLQSPLQPIFEQEKGTSSFLLKKKAQLLQSIGSGLETPQGRIIDYGEHIDGTRFCNGVHAGDLRGEESTMVDVLREASVVRCGSRSEEKWREAIFLGRTISIGNPTYEGAGRNSA